MSGSSALGSLRRAAVILAVGLLAAGGIWWGQGPAHAQAPPAQAQFAYLVVYQGWNLISAADTADISFAGGQGGIIQDTAYGLAPGSSAYQSTPLDQVQVGAGYWVYNPGEQQGGIILDLSDVDSVTVNLPANSCTLIGNPSTHGSARVSGADQVYTFSNLLNQYVPESLLGVGQGGLACNGDHSSTVAITYTGDVIHAAWPDCCDPEPFTNAGKAELIFRNDSPSPLTVALRSMNATGDIDSSTTYKQLGAIDGCDACPEYLPADHSAKGCSAAATTQVLDNVPPGDYHLVIHTDEANVPDLITDITVSANTKYNLCYFIDATRPTKSLWPGS